MKRPRTESTIGFSLNSSNEVKASLNPLNNDESECLTDFMSCKSSSVTTPSDLNSNRPNKSNNALDSSKLSMSSGHRPPTRLVHKVTPNASESASALVIAASDKAGMDGIDRETIDRIILEESGDSLFMQQQRRRDEKVNEKIRQLVIKLEQQNKQSHDWKYKMEHMIDTTIIPKLLSSRPIRSCKVVVDMDMFYMACELLNRPKLKAINNIQPACVGGESMITTSNYAARRYGVRAAMPGYIAKKLVDRISNGKQQLVFCELNFDLYRQKSKQVMLLLKQYDPFCKSYSLDEAYMDIGPYLACKLTKMNNNETWNHMIIQNELESCLDTGTLRNNNITKIDTLIESCHIETHSHHQWNDPNYVEEIILGYSPKQCLDVASDILNEMREHVYQVTGLTCSAGLATNFLLAKIGSDYNKPNGQKIIDANHDSITEFLYPLSIRKICGIGRVTEKILKSFGILTVQDLYQHRALVHFLFQTSNNNNKDSQAFFLLNASIGCSSSDDCSNKDLEKEDGDKDNDLHQKGISRERSFQSGKSWASIMIKLEEIAQLLSQDMQRKHLFAHTISLKVKLHSFDCLSRARTMPTSVFIQSPKELMEEANKLLIDLRKEYMENTTTKTFSIRLIGIRCNNFKGHDEGAADQNGGVKQINLDRFFNTPCSTTRTENYQLQQSEQNQLEMMKPMESTTRNPYMDKKRNLIKSCDGKLEGRKVSQSFLRSVLFFY